jgi:hypothetical protein
MIDYVLAAKIAIFGFVYSDILTSKGMLFYEPYLFLQKKLKNLIFKPLIGCPLCVSGQLSLWIFAYENYSKCILLTGSDFLNLISNHLFFVALTILICRIIILAYQKVM